MWEVYKKYGNGDWLLLGIYDNLNYIKLMIDYETHLHNFNKENNQKITFKIIGNN